MIARAFSVPFAFRDGSPARDELPDDGWERVIRWAHQDWRKGRMPNAVSALEINVLAPYRGRGIAQLMLAAMQRNTHARGFADHQRATLVAGSLSARRMARRHRAHPRVVAWLAGMVPPLAVGCRSLPSPPSAESRRQPRGERLDLAGQSGPVKRPTGTVPPL